MYIFANRVLEEDKPDYSDLNEDAPGGKEMLTQQPRLLEHRSIVERIMNRLMNYVETFVMS